MQIPTSLELRSNLPFKSLKKEMMKRLNRIKAK